MTAARARRWAGWLESPVIVVGRIGAFAIVPLVLIVLVDVVTRKITPLKRAISTSPLNDWMSSAILQDLEWHAHTIILAAAIAYAYLRNGHVRVDLVYASLGPRRQAFIEAAGCLFLLLPFSLLMLKHAIDFVVIAYVSGEQSASLMGVGHTWIIKSALVVCFLMLSITALASFIRAVAVIFSSNPDDPAHRHGALSALTARAPERGRDA